jgi:hypothetical protein
VKSYSFIFILIFSQIFDRIITKDIQNKEIKEMQNIKALLTIVCISLMILLLAGQSYALIDPESIVVMWLFEEGSGDMVEDLSGNGNDGEINGPEWADGKFGKGLQCESNQSLKSPTAEGLSATYMSETLWIKFDKNFSGTENQFGFISCSGEASSRYFYFSSWVNGGPHSGIHLGTIDTAGAWGRGISVPAGVFEDGQWYHVGGVINNEEGSIRAYVDGKLRHEQKFAVGDTPGTPTEIWGAGSPEGGRWTIGVIDEIAFFNVALTEDDINEIMDNGLVPEDVNIRGKLTTTWGDIKKTE